jgi:DNA-binding GntR family transcriptional regulator
VSAPTAAGGELVRPTSLSALAKGSVRTRIIAGEISAGQIYSVPSLADALGVSVTPVREAMLELAAEGLVEAVPNRGFRVVDLSQHDLDEILDLRLMLEAPATVAIAGLSFSPEEIVAHLELVKIIEARAQGGDTAGFLKADRDFKLYGVELLAREGQLEASVHEHRELTEAIRCGDAAAVRTLVTRHLRPTRGVWAGVSESEPT